MAKHRKRLIIGLSVAMAVSAAAIGSSVLIGRTSSAPVEGVDNVRVVDDRKLPEQWMINAAYGRGALSNLRAALGEVDKDNTEEARKGISVAQSLLAKIKPDATRATVSDAGTSFTVASNHDIRPAEDLILVHSEVRVIGDTDPEFSVEKELDVIRSGIDMTDHDAIIAALESLNVPLAYTRVDLPLSETIALVNEVSRALELQDIGLARSKLMAIANGLRVETVRLGVDSLPADDTDTNETG